MSVKNYLRNLFNFINFIGFCNYSAQNICLTCKQKKNQTANRQKKKIQTSRKNQTGKRP